MKILHISQGLVNVSGVDNLIFDLCIEAQKKGHTVEVLALTSAYLDKKSDFEDSGIKVHISPYRRIRDPRHIITLLKIMSDFDIVHVHLFPNQLYSVIAKEILSIFKKKVIIVTTEHNTDNNRRGKFIWKCLDRWMYSRYSYIFTISPATDDALKEYLNHKCKTTIIQNGINLKKFENTSNSLGQHIDVVQDRIYLAMVAKLLYPKDQATVIRSLPYVDNRVQAVFVGDGPDLEKLKNLANEINVSDRIYFLGSCDDIPNILNGVDIGVLSSVYEGFGLAAVEYMASGLPTIATNVAGLREVVGRDDIMFNVGDFKRLATIINRIIKDPIYYNELVRYVKERSLMFSSTKMSDEYLKIYSALIDRL